MYTQDQVEVMNAELAEHEAAVANNMQIMRRIVGYRYPTEALTLTRTALEKMRDEGKAIPSGAEAYGFVIGTGIMGAIMDKKIDPEGSFMLGLSLHAQLRTGVIGTLFDIPVLVDGYFEYPNDHFVPPDCIYFGDTGGHNVLCYRILEA